MAEVTPRQRIFLQRLLVVGVCVIVKGLRFHRLWTMDGTGGDERGSLLTAQNFDDGRCYQINGGNISVARQEEYPDPTPSQPRSINEQWCESHLKHYLKHNGDHRYGTYRAVMSRGCLNVAEFPGGRIDHLVDFRNIVSWPHASRSDFQG
jgi:hypothetical protein